MRTTLRPGAFHQGDVFFEAGILDRAVLRHVLVVVGHAVENGWKAEIGIASWRGWLGMGAGDERRSVRADEEKEDA